MQGIDWNAAIFWLMALQALATLGVVVHSWFDQRRRVSKKEIKAVADEAAARAAAIEKRIDDHRQRLTTGESRFQRIEDHLGRLPTNEAIGRVELAMSDLSGELKVTNQRLEGLEGLHELMRDQFNRMDEFLRKTK
ncbi:hypothetical protein [Hypericibacter sp.]|uniref:hypothetical protein n=1 Tax=Hypericibacter sp. TaxID=2705401 RepID=UPI003D6D06E6